VKAQDEILVEEGDLFILEDSLAVDSVKLDKKDLAFLHHKKAFAPNPSKAIIYSAIFPGLGQIYNRKYWKLPIVYGGFLGCAYAITWNGNQYSGYKRAYFDFVDGDDKSDFWKAYCPYSFPDNMEDWTAEQKRWFSSALKSKRDYYQWYRDLSIIITVGIYAVCMIDAYVDAQLFNFDITPDLSMRVDPVYFEKSNVSSRSFGMQLSITF
jgi:hypothetical protein